MWWKRKKLLTHLNNRKQWQRDFDPAETAAYEIEMEHLSSTYLITQGSDAATPNYIITE